MNIRLLRMTERRNLPGSQCRIFVGLGALQPVLITRKGDGYSFRAEDVEERFGRLAPCWRVLDTRRHRDRVRELLAELIACADAGDSTPAELAWRRIQAEERRAA